MKLHKFKRTCLANPQMIMRLASKYLASNFGDRCTDLLRYLFLIIIYPNKSFVDADPELLEIKTSYHNMLLQFSTEKLSELLKIKEFSVLVSHYLNSSNILDLISKKAVNQLNQDAFKFYIQEIKILCSQNMGSGP